RRLGGETLKCALRFGLAGENGDDVARPRGGLALLIDGKSGEGELTGRVADEFVIREFHDLPSQESSGHCESNLRSHALLPWRLHLPCTHRAVTCVRCAHVVLFCRVLICRVFVCPVFVCPVLMVVRILGLNGAAYVYCRGAFIASPFTT